jgi:hypothetical protein
MARAVMAEDANRLVRLFRWCGIALIAAGVLMVIATLLQPSRETPTTIVASELRLIGLYAAQRGGMGRLGLTGFLTAFSGTYLIAVTGNFGSPRRSWPGSRRQCSTPSASTRRW